MEHLTAKLKEQLTKSNELQVRILKNVDSLHSTNGR
jgi:hypothetical protein